MARKSSAYYREAYKAIRNDVSFSFDMRKKLSPSQKGMITRYHGEIRNQTGFRPTYTYRSRSKAKLEAVKKYTAQEPGFPGLRVAYIPIPNGSGKPNVKVNRKGKVVVVTNKGQAGEVERVGYLFDNYGDVLTDPDGVAQAIIEDDNGKSDSFKMMCGNNESTEAVSGKFINETINRYLETYDNTEKWFFGVIGYSFEGQASFSEYLAKRKEKPRKPKGKNAKGKKGKRQTKTGNTGRRN